MTPRSLVFSDKCLSNKKTDGKNNVQVWVITAENLKRLKNVHCTLQAYGTK